MSMCTDKRRKLKEEKLRKKTSAIKMEEDTDYSDTQSPSGDSLSEETTQENTVDSTVHTEQEELLFFPSSEVPTEIVDDGPGSFSNSFYNRFQVSPDHITDDFDDVIQICQQLEKDLHWGSSSNEGMGFLHNEPDTSPGSQWSDSSSVDELDEFPQYTTLCSNFINPTDDIWACF